MKCFPGGCKPQPCLWIASSVLPLVKWRFRSSLNYVSPLPLSAHHLTKMRRKNIPQQARCPSHQHRRHADTRSAENRHPIRKSKQRTHFKNTKSSTDIFNIYAIFLKEHYLHEHTVIETWPSPPKENSRLSSWENEMERTLPDIFSVAISYLLIRPINQSRISY